MRRDEFIQEMRMAAAVELLPLLESSSSTPQLTSGRSGDRF